MADQTTPCNYAQQLLKSDKEKDSAKVGFKVEKAKLSLQSSILSTKEALATAKQKAEDLKSAFPLNFQAILDARFEVTQNEDALGQLAVLEQELFG